MKKYHDEATQYQNPDDEATQIEDTIYKQTHNGPSTSVSNEVEVKSAKGNTWRRVAAVAGAGLLVGGVASVPMGMNSPDAVENKNAENNSRDENNIEADLAESTEQDVVNKEGNLFNPEWADDEIAVATTINDDMSFGEAFATARGEVGPGGCFEWRGNVYGTYTADEWSNMTVQEQSEWSNHFSWNHIDRYQSDVAQHAMSEAELKAEEPEIEILGVVHDSDTDANIGGLTIDGQDVILIDVDNDLAFDYMAVDANGNGLIESDEVVDIQGEGFTVNNLGGFSEESHDGLSDSAGDLYASNDGSDYVDDGICDE